MDKVKFKILQRAALSEEDRQLLMDEIAHYISMGCYDFTVSLGGMIVQAVEVTK
jgi:hypothetical protein